MVRTTLSVLEGPGLIPGWGTKFPQALQPKKKKKRKKETLNINYLVKKHCPKFTEY